MGIRQQLDNSIITVRICSEEHARKLHAAQIKESEMYDFIVNNLKRLNCSRSKNDVGDISNDFEKLQLDDKGHLCATFKNSKLTRIAPRKPPSKTSASASVKSPGDLMNPASVAASTSGSQTPGSIIGGETSKSQQTPMATDQKYALLFHIEPFQLANVGKFDLWARN